MGLPRPRISQAQRTLRRLARTLGLGETKTGKPEGKRGKKAGRRISGTIKRIRQLNARSIQIATNTALDAIGLDPKKPSDKKARMEIHRLSQDLLGVLQKLAGENWTIELVKRERKINHEIKEIITTIKGQEAYTTFTKMMDRLLLE